MCPTTETLNDYVDGSLGAAVQAEVDEHLRTCADCALMVAELQDLIGEARSLPPVPPPAYVWTRLQAQVGEPRRATFEERPEGGTRKSWSWKPAWVFATAAVVVLAFLAGRVVEQREQRQQAERRQTPAESQQAEAQRVQRAETSASAKVRERVLLVAVGDHLERSQMVLVELANAQTSGELDISAERQSADDLLASNRLYRQTAVQIGQTNVAGLLDDLERVLVEVARGPSQVSIQQLANLQQRIEAQGLLFKVKIIGSEMRERAKPVS
jgi:anti-sigma factor RsiW